MEKNVKILAILSMLLMVSFIATTTIPAFAKHEAWVYWIGALPGPSKVISSEPKFLNDTLILKTWEWSDANPCLVRFAVNNTGPDSIERVQVHIHETIEGFAAFHFISGSAPLYWSTRILEKDGQGWARLIEFYTEYNPIKKENTYNFNLSLGNVADVVKTGGRYEFAVTTIDGAGFSAEHTLYIVFDTEPPTVIVETEPAIVDGVITGLVLPCGRNYFNATVTAWDELSGLSKYNITIYNGKRWSNEAKISVEPGKNWTKTVTFKDYPEGNYTLKVTVWDGAGNKQEVMLTFEYKKPPSPLTISPAQGYAAIATQIKDKSTGLVESQQKIYKGKTLGTSVTVNGYNFGSNLDVTVRVYIPTYEYYYNTYGTYKVLVNKTKTKADGTFTATFIFPKAPKGVYNVSAYTSVMECSTTFEVIPEIIYEPNEVIGPALINVEATGFIKPDIVPEIWSIYVLCNNKDSLQGVNEQVFDNWYIGGNGTLQNMITYATGRLTECGMYWPALEPGTYNITLFVATTGSYWNLDHWEPITNFEHTNTITVKDWTGDVIDAAEDAEDAANAAKDAAEDAVDEANAAKDAATAAKDAATAAKDAATAAKDAATAAKDEATAAKDEATAAKDEATAAKDAAAGVEDAKAAAEGLTIPVYLAVVFSLIAAIVAAACAILVYRKIA